ncbi:MAG: DUF1552 domain-containing protein [Alphaproteobacteria bacterium]|nr:DUF1552 domain-containing protein [Alphaproteobacteria bacterium]
MSKSTLRPSRRAVLKGAGGLALTLPLLESFGARAETNPRYAVFMRQANGCTQPDSNTGETDDMFWPSELGPLNAADLRDRDSDRVLSELADYADRMIALQGVEFGFSSNGCGHSGGGNQVLTAHRVSEDPEGNLSLSMGESIDNFLARMQPEANGGEPLALYTGPRNGYIEEVLSYRGALDLRAAEDDPWIAYQRMLGFADGELDLLLDDRRRSVNDLLLDQIRTLQASPRLSTNDQRKLEQHFDAIRDFERLTCRLTEDEEVAMRLATGGGTADDNRLQFAEWHGALIALAFACDFARAATLQIGDGNDATEFTVNGQRLPNYHYISHRIYSHGSEGEAIEGAREMHHEIDRLYARVFRSMLDRLDEHGILDDTVAVWCNDLANGPSHSYTNVPYILVGSAGGRLATGQHLDAGGVTNNKLFNTLATAILTDGDDAPIEDLGDASLDPGLIDGMLA